MSVLFYIGIVNLVFLGSFIVILLLWIFRPNSKKIYEEISNIPFNDNK